MEEVQAVLEEAQEGVLEVVQEVQVVGLEDQKEETLVLEIEEVQGLEAEQVVSLEQIVEDSNYFLTKSNKFFFSNFIISPVSECNIEFITTKPSHIIVICQTNSLLIT